VTTQGSLTGLPQRGSVGERRGDLGSSVSTTNTHRRPRKIRRTGRHTTPSQVEKVAEVATKAAPAVAIAGVLVAAPAANAATRTPPKPHTVAVQVHTTAKVTKATKVVSHSSAKASSRTYIVEPGDSLASIAGHFYGNDSDWTRLYQANSGEISNPNSIYPGEHLLIPASGGVSDGSSTRAAKHTAKHAKADPPATTLTSSTTPSGTLSCSGLEELWEDAGGSAGEATMAASIAMAESGGNQYALSPTNDYGYWQINGSWGPALATYNALGNAKAAVHISSDGDDWSPWTTYTSGAYYGRC
jgi:LysM repeat protein